MKTKEFNSINILPAGNGVYVELNKSGDNTAPFVFTSMEDLYTFLAGAIEDDSTDVVQLREKAEKEADKHKMNLYNK